MTKPIFSIIFLTLIFSACNNKESQNAPFKLLRKNTTGLEFENNPVQTSEFNVFNYMYYFNGGGVAAGDFNNDGLVDLYFTSNMGPNKLFLNEGKMKFKDVTEAAGLGVDLATPKWTTGASVVDINNDGMLDIYVSGLGKFQNIVGRNLLYVCKSIENGVPVFAEEAIPYGLDLVGFGTQAAFFDYDLDGDLDMFQMNHSLHANGTFGQKKTFQGTLDSLSGDKLLRNDGGRFTNVTAGSGINSTVIGYGLGIVTGDVNLDGWPDIYIGNDFHENDYLYLNVQLPNGQRGFKEVLDEQIQHTSQFSMGVDMADLNNDGLSEIISLDMMPEDPVILKSSLGEDEYGVYQFKLSYGYSHQFARNTLQLNRGDGTFSEIGMFAGVHATDWSWAPLFMDFDNDGLKDLFIANGIPHRMNDIDYVKFRENSDLRWKENTENIHEEDLVYIDKMPKIKLPNKFYKNAGTLRFDDLSGRVEGGLESYSNGAVYADLDNDGDLDVVVNNIQDEPFVYENLASKKPESKDAHLSLKLKGAPANLNAIGTKVVVFKKDGSKISYEKYPVRGYQSSMEGPLHIGIGDTAAVESITVIWPDRTSQTLTGFRYNQSLEVAWKTGLPLFDFEKLKTQNPPTFPFVDESGPSGLNFQHVENQFVEFDRERLIPNMVSTEGPALAVGDVNGDGLEDVFFGSSKRKKSALFLQKSDGVFYEKTPAAILNDSLFEEVDAVFADIENDGDLDLIIAAGGNEYQRQDEAMKQRFYLNDGKGNFQRVDFQGVYMTASCVLPTDFNKDGLVDFFFGARALPWNYGLTPHSALLQNLGNGKFEDVTDKIGGGLKEAGLVKNGEWTDLDGDGDQDLLLAIEWAPLTVFLNNGGKFEKKELNNLSGWWNFTLARDFDGDGDVDILAGNFGENARFKPTEKEPLKLYVNDFDDNDQIEQIFTFHIGGREMPFANFAEITKQLPPLKKKYLMSRDFAKASIPEIFGQDKIAKSVKREANTLKSMYFENTGSMNFKPHDLPDELQFSTLNAATLADLNGDGKQEVILGGNFFECNIEMGRYDASRGNVLTIGKDGKMAVYPLGDLRLEGQVRRIESVKTAKGMRYVFAKNNGGAVVLKAGLGQELGMKN